MGHEMVSSRTRRLAGSLSGFGTKRIIAGVAAAVAVGTVPVANAGIELGEGFSATGFLDMSYYSLNPDGGPTGKSFGIDQFETDFMFEGSDGISAQVDIEYGENSDGNYLNDDPPDVADNTTFVEQAFITKKFNDMFSMKVGRFLSYSGWETEEPTGLFQYSGTGYAPLFYGYYQQGISASYNAGMFSVMGSVVTDVFGYSLGPVEANAKKLGYEIGVALTPIEGLTAKAFYMSDDKTDRDVINVWASYAFSGFTVAAEYNDADYGAAGDADGYLVMGNYATGPWSFTARYHSATLNGADASAITISPSYKVGKNLLVVAEYRMDDSDAGDSNSFALEALFTF